MTTSDLVRELSARAVQARKIATTIRIDARIFDRAEKQAKRWGATISFLVERALADVLDELEDANVPIADHDGVE